jgi:uncharacterized protein YdhG (YjbR/CyaY superfamily)
MQSDAETVIEYLKDLPTERQETVKKVRQVILENLPDGYEEDINWGMITYQVPLDVYPDTYNKKPLMYAALANQKNHIAVYLTGIYADRIKREDFEKAYKATGKRYDVGKSCVRFKKLDDLPLDVLGDAIAAFEMDEFIELIENAQSPRKASQK